MEPVAPRQRSLGSGEARSEPSFVVLVMGDGLDRVVRCMRPVGRWHTVGASGTVPHRSIRIPDGTLLHALLSPRTCDAPWLTEAWKRAGTSTTTMLEPDGVVVGPSSSLSEPAPDLDDLSTEAGAACQSPDDGYGEDTDEGDETPCDEWSLTESGSDGEPYDNIPRVREQENLFDRGRYDEMVALQDIPPLVHLDAERLAIMHNLAALALVHEARRRHQRPVEEPRHNPIDQLLHFAIPRCVALWRWLQRCCACCSCCACVRRQRRDE